MSASVLSPRPPRIFALVVFFIGAAYVYGGTGLAAVGGSPYYLLAGLALVASGALLWRASRWAARLYAALLAATVLWSAYEVGLDLWSWAPRVALLAALGLWFLTPFVRRALHAPAPPPPLLGGAARQTAAASVLVGVLALFVFGGDGAVGDVQLGPTLTAEPTAGGDWPHWGGTARGTRFARSAQITPENAHRLQKLWHVRTGRSGAFKATPIQVGDLLYVCTAMNVVLAVDAESGERRWEFDPQMQVPPIGFNTTCRGVSYHQAPPGYTGACPARILMGTTDARLIALDALTGERCAGFGVDGEVNLLQGMGEVKPNIFMVTSPPLIARNLVVLGARVADNGSVDEPSGVVRAFDAVTGAFAWAWDMGRPGVNTEPAEGEEYTRGTPNVWSMMSFDDELGLIYAPLGNSTPDFFGAHRSAASERYASSVVALDVQDGSVRWSYQTVHHDIWDYDAPSQPVLVDLPQADGSKIPALVQATKRGELFMLDRRTGDPIAEVQERPVPQGAAEGEWLAATQPFSVGLPQFRGPDLTEADMWGITPFDHMWCRTEFRKLRYEGHFTPQSTQGTLQYPGNAGGFNWGSVAIDEERGLLVGAPLLLASRVTLIPRAEVPPEQRRYLQLGTPYAVSVQPFMSPLAVPCTKPPYSRMAVVDLNAQRTVWDKPYGTTNESGPLGMKIGLPLPMGVPVAAGPMITQGGLVFFGGGMDRYFRAIDALSGKEVWRDYLPGSAQAVPMSYVAPRSKRQVVVITVPNRQRRFGMSSPDEAADVDPEGGHIIAYALPEGEA